jgi:Spy/CpxP family protein refolding chaperone
MVILIFGFSTIMAQPQERGWRFKDKNENVPELTSEQKDQIAEIRADHKKQLIPFRADLQLRRVEFRELMRNEASQSELNRLIDEMGKIKTEMKKIRLDQKLKIHDVLTDEQKEFFKENRGMHKFMGKCERGKRFERFHKWQGKGHGFGFFGDDFDTEEEEYEIELYGADDDFEHSY